VSVRTGEDAGGGWIEVEDDGPGIPTELQRRIFEPSFSTKGKEGTGLGLAMVYAFAQRHGGHVAVDSPPDKGARFRIWLPRA
jgi:signal transduction histidine kinase